MRRVSLLLLVAACLCPSDLQAAPQLKTPYHLRVVVHIGDHRFLTPLFQEQFERELRDHLQLALGALARVEVIRTHPLTDPLVRQIREKGLQQALDGLEELSDRKTHFVLLDFRDGRYELQARQHDGKTGMNSPVVRRDATSDRRLVAHRAARLVEQDFGLVGTVVESSGKEVKLAIQGGGLGVSLDRRLRPGDVFAIARISRQGDKTRATRVPWAVLQAIDVPHDGFCRCRFFHRFQGESLKPAGAVREYRCLQLATTSAPVRVRLVDDKDAHPLDGWEVHVRRPDGGKTAQAATNHEGLATTKDAFTHLALVEVIKGRDIRARFPVEMTDDRTVVCRLRSGAMAEAQEALELRRDVWVRRIYDDLRVVSERNAELKRFVEKSLDSALANAQEGVKSLGEELRGLDLERFDIQRQASAQTPPAHLDLHEGEQRLEDLRGRHKDMERFIGRLEKAIKEQTLTRNVIQLLARARLSEEEADYHQAISLLAKSLELKADEKRQARLDALRKGWAVHGPEHAKARTFIYQTWPRLEVADLTPKAVGEAHAAFLTCQKAGDTLTPRKLLLTNAVHAGNLKKRLEIVKQQDNEDSRAEARKIGEVAEALGRLHAEAQGFLTKKKQ